MADIISLEITCGKGVKQITADGITTSFISTTQTITSSKTFDCKVGADLTLTATAKSGYSASDVVWRVLGLDEDNGKTFHYTTDSGRDGIITIEALIYSSSGGDEGGDEGDGDWVEEIDEKTFEYFSEKTEGLATGYYLKEYTLHKILFLSSYQGQTIDITVMPCNSKDQSKRIYMALYQSSGLSIGDAPYFDSEEGYWIDSNKEHWLAKFSGVLMAGKSISATIPVDSGNRDVNLELHLRTYGSSDGLSFPVDIKININATPDWTIQNKLSQGLENFEKFQQSYNFKSYNIYVFSVYNNSNQDATVFLNARSTDNTTTLLGYLNDSWRFNEQIGKPDIYDTSDSGTEISFQKMLSADDTESLLFWVRCEDDADTADVTVTITSTLTGWRKITQVYVYNNSQWKEVTSYVMEGANDNRKILTPYVYVGKSVT